MNELLKFERLKRGSPEKNNNSVAREWARSIHAVMGD
jgi:hypothetical protein